MKRKFDEKLLKRLIDKQYSEIRDDVPYLIKPVPEDVADGMMDPRVLKQCKMINILIKFLPKKPKPAQESVAMFRKMFNTAKSINNWNDGVKCEKVTVKSYDGYEVPVLVYKRLDAKQNLPVFYYIHGGGFFGGGTHVVEQMCKFLTQKFDCLVFSVDYRLCPENHYPTPIDDCYSVLEWIYANAQKYGGDKNKISISGDSAGGNAAAVCTLKDRDNKTGMIKMQYLLYPTVNMANKKTKFFDGADIGKYNINPKQKKYLAAMMGMMTGDTLNLEAIYVQGHEKIDHPYISPIFADLKGLPPTRMFFGEHDFLYIEDAAYARHLQDVGNDVKVTLYKGMGHGFVDQMGVNPQAEDLMGEIAKSLSETFTKAKA